MVSSILIQIIMKNRAMQNKLCNYVINIELTTRRIIEMVKKGHLQGQKLKIGKARQRQDVFHCLSVLIEALNVCRYIGGGKF